MLWSAPYTLRGVGGDLPRPATKVRRTEVSAGLDRGDVGKEGCPSFAFKSFRVCSQKFECVPMPCTCYMRSRLGTEGYLVATCVLIVFVVASFQCVNFSSV